MKFIVFSIIVFLFINLVAQRDEEYEEFDWDLLEAFADSVSDSTKVDSNSTKKPEDISEWHYDFEFVKSFANDEEESEYNFDFLKDMGDEAKKLLESKSLDSTEVDSTSVKTSEHDIEYDFEFLKSLANDSEEPGESKPGKTEQFASNPIASTSDFWTTLITKGSYVENFNYVENICLLFNRKDYGDEDLRVLTEQYNFTVSEYSCTSPDKKVIISFDEKTGKYITGLSFYNLDKNDIQLLGFDEGISYDKLEDFLGYQYYDGLKLSFSVVSYVEPDTLLDNRFKYMFNFSTDSGLQSIWLFPLKPEKIQLNATGQIEFMVYDCVEGDCENGYGVLRWADGYYYKGTFSDRWPLNGMVYRYEPVYKKYTKHAEFENSKIAPGFGPTIFDPKTYLDPIVIKLHEAADEQRKIKSARKDVDYYHHQMQTEPESFEYAKSNMFTYAERGIEYSKECKRLTMQAYNMLVDNDNGNCLDALTLLSQISDILQDVEDVFWILRHVAILNGDLNQAQINIITNFEYLFNDVRFDRVQTLLQNCGYLK